MEQLLLEFLSELEREETRLLGWALVNGFFTESEVIERADRFLDRETERRRHVASALEMVEEMTERGFVFRWEAENYTYHYRTRMGEAVRLMATNRQLFPKHFKHPSGWMIAPRLVSDFRFLHRPRSFPQRNHDPRDWVEKWKTAGNLSPRQQEVVGSLLRRNDSAEMFALSGFQARATERILREATGKGVDVGRPSGTVICAGTGSGKTLAFYLPALTHLAGMLERDEERWVRALALYPRNELLKDQTGETLRQLRILNPSLNARKLTMGTFFGGTPYDGVAAADRKRDSHWIRSDGKCICPFLTCQSGECGGALEWRETDREVERERLFCEDCGNEVKSTEVVLTRKRAQLEPPDILFTTTEMMNQRLTDSRSWKFFGVGQPAHRKPAFLLLDEVHTYSGTHGAQVAFLLRRWLKRSEARPHFVGLSATLVEAALFFAQLTGLPEGEVEEVSPEEAELTRQGAEYLIALRGDPASGASLLSTTIQTAMLTRRVLDVEHNIDDGGVFGRKVFLFTDDLDVTNRMFFNLRDAEGQKSSGQPDLQKPEGSLANLRASNRADAERRFAHGQNWVMSEQIGHELVPENLVEVDRVSSQDSGVATDAELIVATAALEVGFNDAAVGAVIQHKSPHNDASFLQRKGRAGRKTKMRPWTIVVLSDFGRDRLAYQGYDLLFDPELKSRDLPLGNRHILKMQATYAMLDWLGRMVDFPHGHVWAEASQPLGDLKSVKQERRDRVRRLAEFAGAVLEGGDMFDQLSDWLKRALRLTDEELQMVLWEAPRGVMTAAMPTLHRRLATDWKRGERSGEEPYHFWNPLPEFIPKQLFSGLNLPEVNVITRRYNDLSDNFMSIDHALREFAPGRISKRFAMSHQFERYWIPLELDNSVGDPGAAQVVEFTNFCHPWEWTELGEFSFSGNGGSVESIRVLRPYVLRTSNDAPPMLLPSSNAYPHWYSQILPPPGASDEVGVVVDLPISRVWHDLLKEVRFYMHRNFDPARVRRFTTGSDATLRFQNGETREIRSSFAVEGQPVALGFAFEADAIRFRIRLPDDWRLGGEGDSRFAEKLPALRVARFRREMLEDETLGEHANVFEREWIAEIALATLLATAIEENCDLEIAWQRVRFGEGEIDFATAVNAIFQPVETEEGTEETTGLPKRLEDVATMLMHPDILARLDAIITVLWADADAAGWRDWLTGKLMATLGAAFRDAIQQMCTDVDADGLLVDIGGGPPDEKSADEFLADLWISEAEPGGGGVIERLLPVIAEAPRRFLDLALHALSPSDFEIADAELFCILGQLADPDAKVSGTVAAVKAFRDASGLESLTNAFSALRGHLLERGFQISHPVVAALNSRILKPGSNPQTDGIGWEIASTWRAEEARLGVEIDPRSLAYAKSRSDSLDMALGMATLPLAPGQNLRQWRFNALYGLVWPRGSQARNQGLSFYNPFAKTPKTERLLVLDALGERTAPVEFDSENWRAVLENRLVENSRAEVACHPKNLPRFRDSLFSLLTNPLDAGTLLLFPRLRGVSRNVERWVADFELIAPGATDPVFRDEPESESPATDRIIIKSDRGDREEARDLWESLLAVELLLPSREIWLVSPWITDFEVIDNRSGSYSGLDPAWPKKRLRLTEALSCLLERNPRTILRIVTRPTEFDATANFSRRLRYLLEINGLEDRLVLDHFREKLHSKVLVSDNFALFGSPNSTNNGINILEETLTLRIDKPSVSQFLVEFAGHYPAPGEITSTS